MIETRDLQCYTPQHTSPHTTRDSVYDKGKQIVILSAGRPGLVVGLVCDWESGQTRASGGVGCDQLGSHSCLHLLLASRSCQMVRAHTGPKSSHASYLLTNLLLTPYLARRGAFLCERIPFVRACKLLAAFICGVRGVYDWGEEGWRKMRQVGGRVVAWHLIVQK